MYFIIDSRSAAAVSAAKFGPVGIPGTRRFVRSAAYGGVGGTRYFKETQSTMVLIQAEGKKAIENLDAILDVPNISVILSDPMISPALWA